jgi:low affinity Fe/Cu permease
MNKLFARIATKVANAAGKAYTFVAAILIIIIWAGSGPIFHYSDTWQLIINTGTTIITFLMVFVIQNSQNRDGAAIQVKLDELIRSSHAKNKFVGIEHLSDTEIDELRQMCERHAKREDQEVRDADAKADRAVQEVST